MREVIDGNPVRKTSVQPGLQLLQPARPPRSGAVKVVHFKNWGLPKIRGSPVQKDDYIVYWGKFGAPYVWKLPILPGLSLPNYHCIL